MTILTARPAATSTTAAAQDAPARRTQLGPVAGLVLSAFRVVVSVLFFCHGLQGFGFFGGIDGHGLAVPVFTEGFYASLIETVGPALLAIGLASRPVALLMSGTMAFAYFTVHAPTGVLPLLNMGEPAALYSWIFLLVGIVGPGTYALDTLIRRRRTQS